MKIILSGCGGKMGAFVTEAVKKKENCEIVCGVDIFNPGTLSYPVYNSFEKVNVESDVIIDFSNPSNLDEILEFTAKTKIPAVLCTTGYSDEQVEKIKKASENSAFLRSGNMSVGINLMMELAKTCAKALGTDFDVEIVEAHHNQKLDAPSGTALMLEKSVEEGLDYKPEIVYDRHERRQKRDKKEIGMHSIRGGTIVGEHEIIFAGQDEIIKIEHTALSRNIFAVGALNAAVFLKDKKSGLFSMSDVIKS
jgi:4-hydroxy-tetrahydrodipicolinate reductase